MIHNSNKNITKEELQQFENENNVVLPPHYKNFLLTWNGGFPKPNLFHISEEQGVSVLNVFFGIGEIYDSLSDIMELLSDRIPNGFIPIGDDPAGNIICVGIHFPYLEKIYFWDHEQETDDPNEMSNMYFLAKNIDIFLNTLYKDPEE